MDAALDLLRTHTDLGRPLSSAIRTFLVGQVPYSVVYSRAADQLSVVAVDHHQQRMTRPLALGTRTPEMRRSNRFMVRLATGLGTVGAGVDSPRRACRAARPIVTC